MATVGIVIPAYNEGENLHRVLQVVCATAWPGQIVVVDDGSVDETAAVAARYAAQDARLHLLRLPQNRGKAGAMLAGVQALTTDLVVFLDADLIGLRPDCVSALCAPVLAGQCEMTVALFHRGGLCTDGAHKLAPILSGQRCLPTPEARAVLNGLADSGYGVETALSLHAKRTGWRVRYVPWRGVSHVMKEQKRGWIGGVRSRWRMYVQIGVVLLAALGLMRGVQPLVVCLGAIAHSFHARPQWQRVFVTAMAILMILYWFAQPGRLRAQADLRLQDLSAWQPDAFQRVLVVAPHPDDELLAAGGFILSALAAPTPPEIRVIVVTNGDASYSSVLFSRQNPISRIAYRRLAAVRQAESRAALTALGLTAEQIVFLGFPDRGISALWQKNWGSDKPYLSSTTGLSAATQASGADVPFTGEAFLSLVRQQLEEFQPDAVIIPHPRDAHPDHQAVAQFFTLALALNDAEGISSAPHIFAYLMWLQGNSRRQGIRLDQEVVRLPIKYVDGASEWLRFPLAEEISQGKELASTFYQSQKRQLGTMLTRNARGRNELFTEVLQHTVPNLPAGVDELHPEQWGQLLYEKAWSALNLELPGPKPTALWSARDDDLLYLAVQIGQGPVQQNRYRFVVRTVDQDGSAEVRVPADRLVQTAEGRFWLAVLPLSEPYIVGSGRVAVVMLETVASQRVVGCSAWQLFYLAPGASY